jgi:hypothetical protein
MSLIDGLFMKAIALSMPIGARRVRITCSCHVSASRAHHVLMSRVRSVFPDNGITK